MTTFIDGPAAGVSLDLRRAPIMLRVVCDTAGSWDALDQEDDQPKGNELIFVYIIVGEPDRAFVRCARPRAGGYREFARYRLLPTQPADEQVRTTIAWQKWCSENRLSLMSEYQRGNAEHGKDGK